MTPAFSCKRATALVGALVAAAASCVSAQVLQRVTVTSFTLASDTALPHADARFHIVVALRLKQGVSDIENLQLPLLAGLQVLGDVRNTFASARGTLYRETLTVAANSAGVLTIPPATFDAVDARDGKAKQYSTNALTLKIAGPAVRWNWAIITARLLISFGIALMVAGVVVAAVIRRRHPPEPPTASEPRKEAESEEQPVSADPLGDALACLQDNPSRSGALQAREVVWRMVGATDGETLADVMTRVRDHGPNMIPLLMSLERAAFTYDDDVAESVRGAISALQEAR